MDYLGLICDDRKPYKKTRRSFHRRVFLFFTLLKAASLHFKQTLLQR
jgi:hypothetical protein